MEETMYEIQLPEHWTWVELKDLTENPKNDIVDGPFGSNLKSDEYTETGIPVFKIQNIKENRFVDKNINFISPTKAEELSRHSFQKGDLIITKLGNPLGLCCKVPEKYPYGIIVADLIRFRPSSQRVLTQYLMYGVNSVIVQNQFKAITKGTTRPRVNLTIVRGIKFPLPYLPEQRAIVYKIEQLFSELDNGISNLKLAQEQLKVYRQAVLKKAFEGELTKKWREQQTDLPDAEDLLEQIRKEREKAAKIIGKKVKPVNFLTEMELDELLRLPEKWKWVKVGELCDVVRGGSPRPAGDPKYYGGEIPFLKVADLTRSDDVYLKKYEYTIKEAGLKKTRLVERNTLLLSNSGATLGIPKICFFKTTFNDGIAAFLGLAEESLVYHYYFWLSKTKELRAINQGAAQPNLNTDIIANYPFPLCSLPEQQAIVQEIETRLSVCDKIEQDIETNLEKAEALRQSILKKAFEGKLLNEKELVEVRGAEDWEPTEVLLDRLKAERTKK